MMAQTLNKTAIKTLQELHFWRQADPGGGADQLWGSAGYVVETAEGETIARTFTGRLTGQVRADVLALAASITSLIKSEEEIP
jgi:hypothetical protein